MVLCGAWRLPGLLSMSDTHTAGDCLNPQDVEAILLEHPDVLAVALIREEATDGCYYPVAYVVPRTTREGALSGSPDPSTSELRVRQWQRTFDHTYRSQIGDPTPSFVGWTSSFTNKPLSEAEMREWLDNTVERILTFRPERVLEIGCGAGLLVRALAPQCSLYHATDLSSVAVTSLRSFAASHPSLAHVELTEREAADMRDFRSAFYDTVIINSVIQYFPNLDYLRRVIDEAARVVRPGGRIVIGDVRHFGLLQLFHGAVQAARAPGGATVGWLKRRIMLAVEQDRELAVDPHVFLSLPATMPRIRAADVLLKRGRARNEMTSYRFDAVLHVDDSDHDEVGSCSAWEAGDRTAHEIVARINADRAGIARGVRNRRLAADIALLRRLSEADDGDRLDSFLACGDCVPEVGCDPEEIWAFSEEAGLQLSLRWEAHSDEGGFEVVADSAGGRRMARDPAFGPLRPLATDPLEVAYRQRLGLDLQQYLSVRLPPSQIPAAVLAVSRLPESGAGRVRGTAAYC